MRGGQTLFVGLTPSHLLFIFSIKYLRFVRILIYELKKLSLLASGRMEIVMIYLSSGL